jgi:hypothetical protein
MTRRLVTWIDFFQNDLELASELLSLYYAASPLLSLWLMGDCLRLHVMKKPSRRDRPSEALPRNRRECRQHGGGEGRWEFNAGGSLFALGSTAAARRAAYRTAGGELRFLPL